MLLDITDQEREYLLELLETRVTAMYHETHHTDAREYKSLLMQRFAVIEGLKAKIEKLHPASSAVAPQ